MNMIVRFLAADVSAVDPSGLPGYSPGSKSLSATNTTSSEIALIVQAIFGIIGGLAVLAIVLAGLRYITAAGDPQKMSQAKNAIIYSLVGLAISVSAEIIVAFVIKSFA